MSLNVLAAIDEKTESQDFFSIEGELRIENENLVISNNKYSHAKVKLDVRIRVKNARGVRSC
jgi:hypothetical protein